MESICKNVSNLTGDETLLKIITDLWAQHDQRVLNNQGHLRDKNFFQDFMFTGVSIDFIFKQSQEAEFEDRIEGVCCGMVRQAWKQQLENLGNLRARFGVHWTSSDSNPFQLPIHDGI
jgi:hypothetical protein